jgi:hypothetical protein
MDDLPVLFGNVKISNFFDSEFDIFPGSGGCDITIGQQNLTGAFEQPAGFPGNPPDDPQFPVKGDGFFIADTKIGGNSPYGLIILYHNRPPDGFIQNGCRNPAVKPSGITLVLNQGGK